MILLFLLKVPGEIDYAAELEKARAYNEALLPSILPDSFAIAEATEGKTKPTWIV